MVSGPTVQEKGGDKFPLADTLVKLCHEEDIKTYMTRLLELEKNLNDMTIFSGLALGSLGELRILDISRITGGSKNLAEGNLVLLRKQEPDIFSWIVEKRDFRLSERASVLTLLHMFIRGFQSEELKEKLIRRWPAAREWIDEIYSFPTLNQILEELKYNSGFIYDHLVSLFGSDWRKKCLVRKVYRGGIGSPVFPLEMATIIKDYLRKHVTSRKEDKKNSERKSKPLKPKIKKERKAASPKPAALKIKLRNDLRLREGVEPPPELIEMVEQAYRELDGQEFDLTVLARNLQMSRIEVLRLLCNSSLFENEEVRPMIIDNVIKYIRKLKKEGILTVQMLAIRLSVSIATATFFIYQESARNHAQSKKEEDKMR